MLLRALRVTVLLNLIAILAGTVPALAQQPESAQTSASEEEEKPPELVPYRRDWVGGHFQAGVTGQLSFPFGSVAKDVGARTRSGWGGGGVVDLSYGLDRFVALGAYAGMSQLGDGSKCVDCSGTLLGAGAFVRYHVSQGLRIDPWVSYGLGFSGFGGEGSGEVSHYSGVEWLRLQVGADWYLTPSLLLGPVLGLRAAHLIERPLLEDPGGPLMSATLGFRFALDTPGRK
jgi:hypothetical protein